MIQKRKVRQDGWYIKKLFPHFDLPLNFEDAKAIAADSTSVSSKSFWPFIGFVDKKRKFKKSIIKSLLKSKSARSDIARITTGTSIHITRRNLRKNMKHASKLKK